MKKSIAIVFCVLMALVSSPASADTINLTVGAGGVADDYILGEVFTRMDFPQAGGQGVVDTLAINGLLAVDLGTYSGTAPKYWRSATDFGDLPAATNVGAELLGNQTSFELTQVFQYLIVGYDGPNGGSQAYYIGDLAIGDTITLLPKAKPVAGHLTAGRLRFNAFFVAESGREDEKSA